MIAAGLDTAFGVSDLLQDSPVVFKVLRVEVFLLAKLRQQDTNLVGDIRNGVIVGALAPIRDLGCDGQALSASGFVGGDHMVFSLDDLEELLGELCLIQPAQCCYGKGMLRGLLLIGLALGPNGKCAIPTQEK